MSDGGFGKSKSKQKQRVQIPDFLQPFVNQVTDTAGTALSDLSGLRGTDRVADMTPQQLAALGTAQNRAMGQGGFFPTYQNQLLTTAQGQGLNNFLPQNALDTLGSFGQSGASMLPPELMQSLMNGSNGQLDPTSFATLQAAQSLGLPLGADSLLNADPSLSGAVPGAAFSTLERLTGPSSPSNAGTVQSVLEGDFIPSAATDAASQLAGGRTPLGQGTLNAIRQGVTPDAATASLEGMLGAGSAIPDASRNALEATARGDFLYGGEGFDRAVEAAMNAALPQMRSIFGRSRGGATGGLAQESIGRAFADTFAGQYGQERGLQQGAAQALGNLAQTDAQRRAQQNLSAASQLGNQAFQDAGLQLGAQGQLEGQTLAADNQQLNASDLLGRLGISGAQTQLGAQNQLEQQRLAGQQQQFGAANALGGLGLANQGQFLDAQAQAAGLDLQGRGLTQDAASTLAGLGLSQQGLNREGNQQLAQLLGGLASDERNRSLTGAQTLAGFGDAERNRQLAATSALPDAAVADTNLLGQIGQMLQQQQQQELSGQQGFSQMLLAAALSGLPLQSLLGLNQRNDGSQFALGGTATI